MLSNKRFVGIILSVLALLALGFIGLCNIDRSYEKQAFTNRNTIVQKPLFHIDEGANIIKAIELAESRGLLDENQTPDYSSVQVFSNIQEAITIELLTEIPMIELSSDSTMMIIGSSVSLDIRDEEMVNVVSIIDSSTIASDSYSFLRAYFDSGVLETIGYTESTTELDQLSLLEWLSKDKNFYTDGEFMYDIIETITTKDYESIDIRLPNGKEYNVMSYKTDNMKTRSVIPRELKELKLRILDSLIKVKN